MEAPDKIYVPVDGMFADVIYSEWTVAKIINSVEYIRKDMLLRFLDGHHKTAVKRLSCSNDDYDCGQIDAFQTLINKLNDL